MASKTVLTQVNGWTPLIDALVRKHGIVVSAVFGRMWRYCQLDDGVCRATIDTIAAELNISRMTVIRHQELLVRDGYLLDTTPDRRNAPHIYKDTGKAQIISKFDAVINETVSQIVTPQPDEVSQIVTPENSIGVPNCYTGVTNCDTQESQFVTPGVTICDLKRVFKRVFKRQIKDTSEDFSEVFPDDLIPNTNHTPKRAWKQVDVLLESDMPKSAYRQYVQNLAAFGYSPTRAEFFIQAPNPGIGIWADDRIKSTAQRQLSGILGNSVEAVFVIA